MSKKTPVLAKDLGNLISVTQLSRTADGSVLGVENAMDLHTNTYDASIFLKNVSTDGELLHVTPEKGINLSPVSFGKDIYYRHLNHGRFELTKMRTDLGQSEPTPIQLAGSVQQILKQGKHLYIKIAQHLGVAKYPTRTFPKVRKVTHLKNKQDEYGWLPNHPVYELVRFNPLTQHTKLLMTANSDFNLQSIAADEQAVLFIQSPTHRQHDINDARAVFAYDFQTQTKHWITKPIPQGVFQEAQFAPDKHWIAIIGNNNRYPSATVNDFYRYDLKSQTLTNLTHAQDDVDAGYAGGLSTDFAQQRSNIGMRWLTDDTCVFHAYHHGHSQLYRSNGQQVNLLRDQPEEIYDFNVYNDHQLLLSLSTSNQVSVVKMFNLQDQELKVLDNPNREYEEAHYFAKENAFNFETKDHQTKVYGKVLTPQNFSSKLPVLLYVHGGPHDAYGDSFMHEFQFITGQGYAVVYVNPRGSTTYGQKFETAIIGKYGQKDYADVMQGLDVALQKYNFLDSHRVAIMGGSYGGFMTLWAIGHTNRFQAAVAQRPLADWPMMYGTSDIGIRFSRDELGKDLYRDQALDFYWNQSPIKYASNVRTPLLLQHGEYDMRCPVSQSEAYFTAVKQYDDDVTYLRYPQSYHGVSRHGLPSMRVNRLRDIVMWLNDHLK